MRRAAVLVGLLAGLGAAFQAGSWYQQRGSLTAAAPDARRVLYYQDAMQHRSDTPGPCRECGMSTEPIYEGSAPAPAPSERQAVVRVAPDTQRALGLELITVGRTARAPRLRLYGRVAADETRLYKVNAGTEGFVREVAPVTTGCIVGRYEWLATLSAPEARQAMQAYLVAVDAYERTKAASDNPGGVNLANAGIQQAADRLLALGMSPLQMDEMRRTRLVPPNIRVAAPAAGVVLSRDVTVGQKFDRGDELYRIADLSRVWIHAEAFGAEADYIRPGLVADVAIPGRSRTFRAVVSRNVLPEFDGATQSVRFRLEADNPDVVLRPDMFVDVHVTVQVEPAITVPTTAVIDTGLRRAVFVATSDSTFEPRAIETGLQLGSDIVVLKGLAAGDRVVVSGTFLLDSESRMRLGAAGAVHSH